MTALHDNSKSDTILLLDLVTAAITVDLGPARTNLTDQTTYIEETPSARSAVDAPRNITVKLTIRPGWTGVILELGDGIDYSYQISITADELYFAEWGVVRCRLAPPDLVDAYVYLINWSQRIEGANTIDEVTVGNLDLDTWAFDTDSHAAAASDPTHDLTIAASAGGASPYTGLIEVITGVHIGRRYHAAPEAWEDWGTQSTAPSFDGESRSPILTSPSTELLIASDGALNGPSSLIGGAALLQQGPRCVGSLVNLTINTPNIERVTADPVRFYRETPDGVTGWQWCIRYLWHGYLGLKVNTAQVRIHVRAFDDPGAGVTISPVRFRVFSVADLPLNGTPAALTYNRGSIVSVTAVSAAGVWVDLGTVRLARDDKGLTYLALGFLIDAAAGEGVTFDTAWQLNAITVDPYAKDLGGGGQGGDMDLETP